MALQPSTPTLSPRPPTTGQQNQPAWVLHLADVRVGGRHPGRGGAAALNGELAHEHAVSVARLDAVIGGRVLRHHAGEAEWTVVTVVRDLRERRPLPRHHLVVDLGDRTRV